MSCGALRHSPNRCRRCLQSNTKGAEMNIPDHSTIKWLDPRTHWNPNLRGLTVIVLKIIAPPWRKEDDPIEPYLTIDMAKCDGYTWKSQTSFTHHSIDVAAFAFIEKIKNEYEPTTTLRVMIRNVARNVPNNKGEIHNGLHFETDGCRQLSPACRQASMRSTDRFLDKYRIEQMENGSTHAPF